jgi:hypothetical protein
MKETNCFDIFEECVKAIQAGDLIESESEQDKEFHFQNWFRSRLENLGVKFDAPGRNSFPDFRLVNLAEGYEVKGLKWPGRESTYDSNSQVPTGLHNGRDIYYAFGRYPADLRSFPTNATGRRQYPVVDLVICHGDFLNADHNYAHKNRNVKSFGSYGDMMIRDRKMYVAPTPFAMTEGTTGLRTLIVPAQLGPDSRFQEVGRLTRVEASTLLVGYTFNLRTNELRYERVTNPTAGAEHRFVAYRLAGESPKPVAMTSSIASLEEAPETDPE